MILRATAPSSTVQSRELGAWRPLQDRLWAWSAQQGREGRAGVGHLGTAGRDQQGSSGWRLQWVGVELRMPTETPRGGCGGGASPGSSPLSRPPCLSHPFTEGSWANRVPVGEAESSWAVRRLPSHPRAPTLQDLWVLFLPLGPLDCSRVPMGSVSLLPSWPQNSGDPVSEPATHHHVFQTLKSCPPAARFPRGGPGLQEVQSLLEVTQNVGGRGDGLQAWDWLPGE